jgi:hypothetical protein
MPQRKVTTVRRSVALPRDLVREVLAAAPPEMKGNLNRLVVTSLRDFVARRRADQFEKEMAAMAADPGIRSGCEAIADEFATTEWDGLK